MFDVEEDADHELSDEDLEQIEGGTNRFRKQLLVEMELSELQDPKKRVG